ncbi:PREDICTED: inactive serine protease 54 isoform X1 [Myotis davidii]|uniref:inactive serine protease 54 isoform X1 n=2 Tax=Myotis davidii TaxID=225400 RepID=UPI0007674346|nr:PREDICTED: inactive serine protease 54 isoform X1 [Myotis davidii]
MASSGSCASFEAKGGAFYSDSVKARVEFQEPNTSTFLSPDCLGSGDPGWIDRRGRPPLLGPSPGSQQSLGAPRLVPATGRTGPRGQDSCPWCLLRPRLGTAGMLLVLLCASHASASCGIQKTNVIETSEEGLVSEKEFPWVVSLQNSHHAHLAFGSILSEFWILSIASAFQHRKDAVAVVGIARMNASVVSHEEFPVNTIIVHEDFDNKTMANDLALLKTDTAMQFTSLVQPICFLGRKLYMPLASHNCWVAGWNPTLATGEQMTMSILRKISVQDIDLCPLYKFQNTGCGSHVEQETDTVCLGDPGNPLMCQLQGLDLWVLQGVLSQGGERCPGLFLYVKVEDYGDWITSQTEMDSLLPLAVFHHYHPHQENAAPTQGPSVPTRETQLREPAKVTIFMDRSPWPENGASEGVELRGKGVRELDSSPEDEEALPPDYDYYSEQAGQGGSISGQNRLHQPQETLLLSSALVFFWNSRQSGS